MARHFLWDPVEDNIIEEFDDDGNVIAEYTTEPGYHGAVISEHRNGQSRFPCHDAQGNTLAMTDEHGNVTDTFGYTAGGELTERTGTTPTPFQFGGEYGYYTDQITGEVMVRRRDYDPPLGRWLAVDPLGLTDGPNPYLYVHNNPINFADPTGLLTVVPRTQELDERSCGSPAFMAWDFLLDILVRPKAKKSDKGAPCVGYVVQHVVVACSIVPCVKGQCAVDLDQIQPFEYWEAWPVPAGKRLSPSKQDRGLSSNDKASITIRNNACGYYYQTGDVRFYCADAADPNGNGVGADLRRWHNPATDGRKFYGEGECRTTPGFLLSTNDRPGFWEKKPMDGPAFRYFIANWDCCPCRGIKRIDQPLGGDADAAPRIPPKEEPSKPSK